ncbi:MAG: 16S rRNA (cytidine(1402)-2'-O)-methyltransferase [Christensenellaceae bacterium]
MENKKIPAKLYLCATPIGNLEDITLRCLRILRGAAAVYCEDTRNTLKLMNHFEIKKTLISCHEHNEEQRANEIAERVRGGEAIAFVSDAGMPGVSDPGSRLVRFFVENNLPFEVLPGANAVLTAWVMSGLPTESLYFCGFIPRSGAERSEAVERIKNSEATVVLYESHIVLLQLLLIFLNFSRIVNAHWYGKSQRLLNRSYAERRRSLPHGLRKANPKGSALL